MKLTVHDNQIHIATGGREAVADAPYIIFLHGSGQSHLSWVLQTRYFAYEGYNILAPDFPGHGLSEGVPLQSIAEMTDWVVDLIDQLGIEKAVIVGHSQGGLVALDLAARYASRVEKLVLVATALSIPVNDYLITSSKNKAQAAITMMTGWGHGRQAHFYDNSQPGFSHLGFGRALMAGNEHTALHSDLLACNAYHDGPSAAEKISMPVLAVLAGADKMTPLKKGKEMVSAITDCRLVVVEQAGHMLPAEEPDAVNGALKEFLKN